jgi:gliding motility-associated-like protein
MKKLSASLGLPRLGLLLLLWLAALAAHSQNACPTPPPANCPEPFRVVDAGTGQEVRTLTVGCPVRFVQAACRPATLPSLLYYQVVKGSNAIPTNCLPTTTAGVTTYTPTAADVGPVTVFELSNPDPNSGTGGAGVAYIRNYQVVSPTPPGFTVAACAGNTALITLLNSGYDQYTVRINGGAPQPLTTQPVAIVPGVANTFVVTGSIVGSSCLQTTSLTLTLPVAQTPVLARLTRTGAAASGGPAQFELTQIPAGFTYTLQAQTAGQAYQTVPGIPANIGAPVAGFEVGQVPPGRYRIVRTDACGNTAASAEIPTLGLSGTADNGRNTLTFDLYGGAAGATSYSLARADGVVFPLAGAATTYVDTNVQCGTAYTYRLTATLPGGGQTVSNPLTLTAQSTTPPSTPLLVASFDLRNRVVLTATPGVATFAAGGQLTISKQAGGTPVAYAPLRTGRTGASSLSQRDSTALGTLLAAPPCYTATLRDTCGNVSAASPSSCPALLTVEAADPEGQSARLSWSAFQGPGSPAVGATYQVLTLAADGTVLAVSAPLTGLTYLDSAPPLDRQILRYRVVASGAGLPTGAVSYSNVGTLTRRPRLVMPTAFTPNGDGLNDVLELKGRYLQNFTFIVVDRNGQEVFRSTDRAKTWDGSINGHAPVNAAYVWRFDLLSEDNQPLRQTGTITILK